MRRPEQSLSIQVANTLRAALHPSALFAHIPNGGARTKAEGGIFKAMGVRAGWPDYQILWAGGRLGFIELKSDDGALAPVQIEMHGLLKRLGFPVAVCRSVEEVMGALAAWGVPTRGRIAA